MKLYCGLSRGFVHYVLRIKDISTDGRKLVHTAKISNITKIGKGNIFMDRFCFCHAEEHPKRIAEFYPDQNSAYVRDEFQLNL